MSRKSVLSMVIVSAGDMSGSITSSSVNTKFLDNIGLLVEWTGSSPVGTLSIEVQNGSSGWSALDFGTPIAVTGASGNLNININETPFEAMRVKYIRSSGTGAITVTLAAKTIGA